MMPDVSEAAERTTVRWSGMRVPAEVLRRHDDGRVRVRLLLDDGVPGVSRSLVMTIAASQEVRP